MFEKFVKRESSIFDILQQFIDAKLDFVMIGGYAVSSYKHRLSVDADIVIESKNLEQFEKILKKNKFTKTDSKRLDNIYSSEFMRYTLKGELPISIALLINGIGARQTGASFGFEVLNNNSKSRKIIGLEKEILAKIPSKEMLIVLKLHSGRLTDLRDIVALCKSIDFEIIKKLVNRGDTNKVKQNINKLVIGLNDKNFIDSFKGVFIEKKYNIDIEAVKKLEKLFDRSFEGRG